MNEKLKAALEILYGNAEYPVCAADSKLDISWQSAARAAELTESSARRWKGSRSGRMLSGRPS